MAFLVTGGAGFIGSNLVRHLNAVHGEAVVTVDKLTYAGHRENLAGLAHPERHTFVHWRRDCNRLQGVRVYFPA